VIRWLSMTIIDAHDQDSLLEAIHMQFLPALLFIS